ncbi:MAG TPA: preprotein translocase subunit SecY [Steroidobacteraceae bacterium]|nr:preprotein translocase subunit SecY [Steroidobacteraceae bacterium]
MSSAGANPMSGLGAAARLTEIRQRLFFLMGGLIVYRIGTFIPTPGIDPIALAKFFQEQEGTILGLFNMFSGGALSRLSIFALGVMPYISASIIIQMVAVVYPPWAEWRKEGEAGRRRITQLTRYTTVFLSIFQGLGASYAFQNQGVVLNPGWYFLLTATVTLTTGTLFLMWLGEQITERGIGNGISMIILSGIIAGLPAALGNSVTQIGTGEMNPAFAIVLLLVIGAVTMFVVFVESGQRRIAVNYAKRMVGRRMLAGQSSHLPFKLNMSGVIPPIFASSLLLFPATLANFAGTGTGEAGLGGGLKIFMQNVAAALGYGQPLHMLLYGTLIVFFCFFYTGLVFNSRETADNLKKAGAFIPGIRPGQQTGEYIDRVLTRLTLWGAVYVTAVCLLPEILISWGNVPFYFGGTSLLIIVVVVMDFIAQLRAHMMSHQYEGLIKKANLRGVSRAGAPR